MSILKPTEFALDNSEQDDKRSAFVFELLNKSNVTEVHSLSRSHLVPQKIIQFWDDSTSIPNDVMSCMESWKVLNDCGYDYTLYDKESAREYIDKNLNNHHLLAFDNCYHPAMESDYFRLCYIYNTGGMYVDADDLYTGVNIDKFFSNAKLKLQPLCYDILNDKMVCTQFIFNNSFNINWIYYFNNNPLIASPFNNIVGYALDRATSILTAAKRTCLPEIQSTAGPGNISASVISAYLTNPTSCQFEFIADWEQYSTTIWSLSYRHDSRNWRRSNRVRFLK